MPLSTIVKQKCSVCEKTAVEKSRIDFLGTILVTLECGHVTEEQTVAHADYSTLQSSDGKKLMAFQINGVRFLEDSGGRALLADEQGLGKTVQAAAFIKLHLEEVKPVLVVTKTTLKLQWMWELLRWTGNKMDRVQVLNSSKEIAVPGFDIYITTYDLIKDEKVFAFVDFKAIILDECQAIKNHLSGRAKAVQKIAGKCEYILGLSGTPIKNNAGEYFTILNCIKPRLFPEYYRFLREDCDSYESGGYIKVGGLSRPDRFTEKTKDFILRRTKAEVLPDLPELSRQFHHVELNPKFNAAYAAAYKELEELYYKEDDDYGMAAKIAVMTKMRKITGLSKVTECVEFTTDFLLSTNRKLVIFVHHHSVADLLQMKLNQWMKDGGFAPVTLLNAQMDADTRAHTAVDFESSSSRVMIASTLAAGEGLNLQYMSDAIMLERQWNPANEEQAEARFHRFGQKNPVNITYMLATETIDEYFTELVEQKRAIVASTLDGREIMWESNSLMKELAETLIRKGAKKWTL